MSTTTSDGGSEKTEQPQTSEAVAEQDKDAQVITTDENGTPTLAPTGAEAAPAQEEDSSETDAQAPAETSEASADDVEEWAKKKGLPLEDPKKLAAMYRDAEKKMHQATEKARELETAATSQTLDYTGDPNIDALNQQVNTLLIQNSVRDFFQANPEAREYESKMAEIVTQRPHLKGDLDALYALAKTDPNRESELKNAGGREALTNLAQKQQQIPPGANATNSGVYASGDVITPGNVFDLIEKNDQAWFQKNYKTINKAISGK